MQGTVFRNWKALRNIKISIFGGLYTLAGEASNKQKLWDVSWKVISVMVSSTAGEGGRRGHRGGRPSVRWARTTFWAQLEGGEGFSSGCLGQYGHRGEGQYADPSQESVVHTQRPGATDGGGKGPGAQRGPGPGRNFRDWFVLQSTWGSFRVWSKEEPLPVVRKCHADC